MWLAGALGVACGAGYYFLATIGTVFALIVLVVLGKLEKRLNKSPDDDDAPPPAGEQRDERRMSERPHS
jgi:putative Mg2+ transporter-C (MgtC) family protein